MNQMHRKGKVTNEHDEENNLEENTILCLERPDIIQCAMNEMKKRR